MMHIGNDIHRSNGNVSRDSDLELPYLSIILPVRISQSREYILEHLTRLLSEKPDDKQFEFIVVDSGSNEYYQSLIHHICEEHNARYLFHDTSNQVFSIGLVRNFGAKKANSPFIMFMDVDLIGKSSFFHDVSDEIRSRGMDTNITDYFIIPCFYLTKDGSQEFLSWKGDDSRFRQIIYIYEDATDKKIIDSFAPSTSVMIVNRHHYLSLGGHRNIFYGHGSEDFELLHRLTAAQNKYQRPSNYYFDKKNYSSVEYEGFRSLFSMAGYSILNTGIYLLHLWHPRPRGTYHDSTKRNQTLLAELMQEFDEGKAKIDALDDLTQNKKTLIFGVRRDRAMLGIRQILPMLGLTNYISEYKLGSVDELQLMIEKYKITQLFFWNPYANEARLEFYRWARKNSFPYLVFERGALPDSWFIDDNGFNSDSQSYSTDKWDSSLTDEESEAIEDYIESIALSGDTLEENGSMVGKEYLRELLDQKYRIDNKRVLFIPFQRPSDTVTVHHAGHVENFDGFIELVNEIIRGIDLNEWAVIAKKHPLESSTPSVSDKIIFVDDNTHIHDLVALADKVLLMNSGVGVLSMLFGTPVCYVSNTYYGHPEINREARNSDEVLSFMSEEFVVSRKHVRRYIHHLRYRVYSFAKATVEIKTVEDGSQRSVTTNLRFYELRGVDGNNYEWKYRNQPIKWDSKAYGIFLPSIIRMRKQINFTKGASGNRQTSCKALPTLKTPEKGYIELFNLGCAAYHRSDYDTAEKHYTEAMSLQPSNANLRRILAETLLNLGHHKEAIIHIKKAHELVPVNKAIKRRLRCVTHPLLNLFTRNKAFPVPTSD